MKQIINQTLLLLFLTTVPFALDANPTIKEVNNPEKIRSITQEYHEPDYYQDQANLWKEELNKDKSNASAWLNYYLACKYVNLFNGSQPYELSEIYDNLSKEIPNSYEYHYLTYLNSKGDPEYFHHLEQAYEIDPSRTEVYSHFINFHEVNRNQEQLQSFLQSWLESGEISQGILNWNYNALMSVEKNGILLTQGDNDTYPAWMLQKVHNVRPDVKVLNIHLLKQKSYCDAICQENQMAEFPTPSNGLTWENDFKDLATHIFDQSSVPVYMNVTLPREIREFFSKNLYTVGLAFKFSRKAFDNIAVLKNNFENKFMKDYLQMNFQTSKSKSVINSMNQNYLPALIILYKHYTTSEELGKASKIKNIITNVAIASNRENEIESILGTTPKKRKQLETIIDIKQLDKEMKVVKGNLWASSLETTNEMYEQFLMDLLRNKEFELLELCKNAKTDWRMLLPDMHKDLKDYEVFSNGHPDDPRAPVQNISYEAAVAFCNWLTEAYNAYPKKKEHMQVKFKLPTEEEWMYAAKGGRLDAPYPWGGYYHKNAKGCALSNFYMSEDPPCENCDNDTPEKDGGFFTVKTGSYFPNDFGLYNMSGNLAEMVEEKGVAKGGSWEDTPEQCKIDKVKNYQEAGPAIGFRIFMEVIQ